MRAPVQLDAGPRSGGRGAAAPARTSPAGAQDMGGGAMFEDDDDGMGGGGAPALSLELDVRGGPPIRGHVAPQSAPPPGPAAMPMGTHSQQSASFRPMPAGVPDRRPSVAPVESFEAKVLANFGESPKHFWQAPFYAWRVRQRLAELRGALKERRKLAERASEAIDQALVALGQRARGAAQLNPQYGRTLDLLRINEQTLRQKDSALMTEMDGHNRKLAQIDQKISELQAVTANLQAEERRVSDELAMAQATVQRAEAKLKRLDIDLRSAFGPNDPRRPGS